MRPYICAGDIVYYNGKSYKVLNVYQNGTLKLRNVRGKVNEVLFHVPQDMIFEIQTGLLLNSTN